jgi:surface carbohydrate biosynthesis protein
MNVVILSLVPQRDWQADQMIADELVSRGHKACVRNYVQDGRAAIIAERPDVVIMPVIRCEYSRDFATRMKQWGIKVIARRSEAGVSRKRFTEIPKQWQLDHLGRYDYKDLIDLELVWSKEFSEVLVENNKIRRDQVRPIGAILLDPYFRYDVKSVADKLFKKTKNEFNAEHGFDNDKKTLLFCTGFVHADSTDFTLPEAPVGDPIHQELYLRDKNIRESWIKLLAILTEQGNHNIIVRPHQGEDDSIYKGQNVVISRDGTAGESLYYSDVMIHSGSTMAVEAHLLGMPAIRFGNTSQDNLIGNISPSCETAEECLRLIDQINFGETNANISSLSDLKDHFYGDIDGKSYMRCADAVCEFDGHKAEGTPNMWPEEELKDYSTEGVVRIASQNITNCGACKKQFQVFDNKKTVPCPHCGIAVTIYANMGICNSAKI